MTPLRFIQEAYRQYEAEHGDTPAAIKAWLAAVRRHSELMGEVIEAHAAAGGDAEVMAQMLGMPNPPPVTPTGIAGGICARCNCIWRPWLAGLKRQGAHWLCGDLDEVEGRTCGGLVYRLDVERRKAIGRLVERRVFRCILCDDRAFDLRRHLSLHYDETHASKAR